MKNDEWAAAKVRLLVITALFGLARMYELKAWEAGR